MFGKLPFDKVGAMIGSSTQPVPLGEVPPHINDYRLIKVIGRGGFGTVWLAEETTAGVFRAIKVLDGGNPATDQQATSPRIDRELEGIHAYQVLAQEHPHLVRILKSGTYEVAEAGGPGGPQAPRHQVVYYVMEIADHAGGTQPYHAADYQPLTLAALLQREGPLACAEVLERSNDLLAAIDHLHKAGLHHRDIKPANCLLVGGVLKLADVGLTASENAEHIGTTSYLPPEGPPDDLYALGKVMYELTTGLPASDFPDWPADLDPATDSLLPPLRELINELCYPSAARRLSDVRAIRSRLARIEAGPCVVRMTRRRAGFAVAAVAAVALAVGIGADRFAGWWADPLTGARGVAPNDGFVDNQSREASGYLYQLQRFHKPAVHYILGNERAEWAELWDLQTKLGRAINDETGQEDDCLTVAGGYRLYTAGNPVTGDAEKPVGEIVQIYLLVGDKTDQRQALLYHGQPGPPPGARGRFVWRIPLTDLAQEPAKPGLIRLVLVRALTPELAEVGLAAESDRWIEAVVLGTVHRIPRPPTTP